jgi:RNA polymerase sigma-70 factor, ECF subfamily
VYDESVVEDIGQEVFISAYRSLDNFDAGRGVPFAAWLFTIARNRCITMLRKRKTAVLLPLSEAMEVTAQPTNSPDADLCSLERRQALSKALEQLSEPFRSTMMESLKGRSIDEIAEKCGIKAATVKTRLFRARENLKRLFSLSNEAFS